MFRQPILSNFHWGCLSSLKKLAPPPIRPANCPLVQLPIMANALYGQETMWLVDFPTCLAIHIKIQAQPHNSVLVLFRTSR